MAEYTWAFDRSFLVFLLIAFTSMALAEKMCIRDRALSVQRCLYFYAAFRRC